MQLLSRLLDICIGILLSAFGLRFIVNERPFELLDGLAVIVFLAFGLAFMWESIFGARRSLIRAGRLSGWAQIGCGALVGTIGGYRLLFEQIDTRSDQLAVGMLFLVAIVLIGNGVDLVKPRK